MKKLILSSLLLLAAIVLQAQGSWSQFGKVTRGKNISLLATRATGKAIQWYVKPGAQLSGFALQWNKELGYEAKQFAAFGLGIALQHYAERDGILVPDFSVDGLFITNIITPTSPGFGAAVGITALGFVNITAGRDFTNKVWLFMPGATWTF